MIWKFAPFSTGNTCGLLAQLCSGLLPIHSDWCPNHSLSYHSFYTNTHTHTHTLSLSLSLFLSLFCFFSLSPLSSFLSSSLSVCLEQWSQGTGVLPEELASSRRFTVVFWFLWFLVLFWLFALVFASSDTVYLMYIMIWLSRRFIALWQRSTLPMVVMAMMSSRIASCW